MHRSACRRLSRCGATLCAAVVLARLCLGSDGADGNRRGAAADGTGVDRPRWARHSERHPDPDRPRHGRPRRRHARQRQGPRLDPRIGSRRWASTAGPHDGLHDVPFTFSSKAGATIGGVNLLALCPGRRPELPVIVVSAHYDHLGIRDGQTYHGADDNASGVAMLLTVAERCVAAPFDRTLVIAAFDAEEHGLAGRPGVPGAAAGAPGTHRPQPQLRHGEPQRQAGDLRRRPRTLAGPAAAAEVASHASLRSP